MSKKKITEQKINEEVPNGEFPTNTGDYYKSFQIPFKETLEKISSGLKLTNAYVNRDVFGCEFSIRYNQTRENRFAQPPSKGPTEKDQIVLVWKLDFTNKMLTITHNNSGYSIPEKTKIKNTQELFKHMEQTIKSLNIHVAKYYPWVKFKKTGVRA